jgi:hypothetical protein
MRPPPLGHRHPPPPGSVSVFHHGTARCHDEMAGVSAVMGVRAPPTLSNLLGLLFTLTRGGRPCPVDCPAHGTASLRGQRAAHPRHTSKKVAPSRYSPPPTKIHSFRRATARSHSIGSSVSQRLSSAPTPPPPPAPAPAPASAPASYSPPPTLLASSTCAQASCYFRARGRCTHGRCFRAWHAV